MPSGTPRSCRSTHGWASKPLGGTWTIRSRGTYWTNGRTAGSLADRNYRDQVADEEDLPFGQRPSEISNSTRLYSLPGETALLKLPQSFAPPVSGALERSVDRSPHRKQASWLSCATRGLGLSPSRSTEPL